jgi:hypothetical protein
MARSSHEVGVIFSERPKPTERSEANMMTTKPIAPRVKCKDGTTLSVQASRYHYSKPRQDEGPYANVEVGYIEDAQGKTVTPPGGWREYSDGSEFPNDVYGYIPRELVEKFIAEHGGAEAPDALKIELAP